MSDRRKVLEFFEAQRDYTKKRSQDIERYRKGDACVTVRRKDGTPVPNARVSVKQTGHAFKYGCNLFMLDELETKEKNDLYKKYMADFGNIATLPFYWDATEPEPGKTRYAVDSEKMYRRPPIDLCMEFCEQHGIEPREHALAYENFFPRWLYGADTETVKAALEARYRQIAERYADRIPTIEVTNEMDWPEGRTQFYDDPDFILWCFQKAEEYFPNNQLVINEGTPGAWQAFGRTTDKYYAYTQANMLRGARIDAIGMQYHMFIRREKEYEETRKLYNPISLYKHMDLFSLLGKPLQITEVTIPAYSWEPEDEEIQAEVIRNLYTVWFSHPNVEQIVYWNMIDGYAYVRSEDPEVIAKSQGDMTLGENYYYGGLLRFDLTPKPAYWTIRNLFEKVWHTEETLTADADGSAAFRGFYGTYEVTVHSDGRTRTVHTELRKDGSDQWIIEI